MPKHGQTREDGKRYRGLNPSGTERWMSEENYQKYLERQRLLRLEITPEAKARYAEARKKVKAVKPAQRAPENRAKKAERNKRYREKNPKDPAEIREYDKRRRTERGQEFLDKRSAHKRNRLKSDPMYRMQCSVRSRLGEMIRKIKAEKPAKTIEIVGCSWVKLKKHIQSQFTQEMTWENHGRYGWHIDHVIPLSCATEIKGLTKLCHYSNLRPVWAKDNLSKGNNLTLQ